MQPVWRVHAALRRATARLTRFFFPLSPLFPLQVRLRCCAHVEEEGGGKNHLTPRLLPLPVEWFKISRALERNPAATRWERNGAHSPGAEHRSYYESGFSAKVAQTVSPKEGALSPLHSPSHTLSTSPLPPSLCHRAAPDRSPVCSTACHAAPCPCVGPLYRDHFCPRFA